MIPSVKATEALNGNIVYTETLARGYRPGRDKHTDFFALISIRGIYELE